MKSRRPCSQILSFLCFSSFVLKENLVFNEESNPTQEVTEELDGIDIDDIWNLMDFPGFKFIDEGFGNSRVVD